MTATVVDALLDGLIRSWRDQRGAALSVTVTHGQAGAFTSEILDLAAGAGAAVSSIDGHAGPSLFHHLRTGPSPVLSPPTARLLDALQGSRLAQIRLLERLLRCHARHRAVLLVIDLPVELDASARWILKQLCVVLNDAAVTWLWVQHDQTASAGPTLRARQRTQPTATGRTAFAGPVSPPPRALCPG